MTAITRSKKRVAAKRRLDVIVAVHKKLAPKTGLQKLHNYALRLQQAKTPAYQYRGLMLKAQRSLQIESRQVKRSEQRQGLFPMSGLPAELRNSILEYAMCESQELSLATVACPAALMVSHEMRREALPAFFAVNKFHAVFLKNEDGKGHDLQFHPSTLGWLKQVHRQTYHDISWETFMKEVCLIKHLTFTRIHKVEDLDSPHYREFRIDYDYRKLSVEDKRVLAAHSATKTAVSKAIIWRDSGLTARIRRTRQSEQGLRDQLTNAWFELVRRRFPKGLPLHNIVKIAERITLVHMITDLVRGDARYERAWQSRATRTAFAHVMGI